MYISSNNHTQVAHGKSTYNGYDIMDKNTLTSPILQLFWPYFIHISNCKMFSCRFWEEFPPFPSIRQRAARSIWIRSPWTVTLSVPRAPRWTFWYRMEMMNMWVLKERILCSPSVCLWVCSFNVFLNLSLFYRGSFQYQNNSRLSGMAPNWWQNLLRSQADYFIFTTEQKSCP